MASVEWNINRVNKHLLKFHTHFADEELKYISLPRTDVLNVTMFEMHRGYKDLYFDCSASTETREKLLDFLNKVPNFNYCDKTMQYKKAYTDAAEGLKAQVLNGSLL